MQEVGKIFIRGDPKLQLIVGKRCDIVNRIVIKQNGGEVTMQEGIAGATLGA